MMSYNRQGAIEYAERWWNSHNPQFELFLDDCTNFISQCLWAGGAPMRGQGQRNQGWWYKFSSPPNWSYSWSVAHSFTLYLQNSQRGLTGIRLPEARLLIPGDVICYDFDGDGRWQHTAIVVAKDRRGEPLMNMHTYNRRLHPWPLRDSSAYTERIQYAFIHIEVK